MKEIIQKTNEISQSKSENNTDSFKYGNKLKNYLKVNERIVIDNKKMNKKKIYKNNLQNIEYLMIIKITIIIHLFQLASLSNITLIVKGSGYNKLFGSEGGGKFDNNSYPKEIYINGYKQNNINYYYNFTQTINFVELIWDNAIYDCSYMFHECTNITEINLINFNSSKVVGMHYMFYGCSSLISLNLSNFDTSQVTSMGDMFNGCSSLISLDLSNFDTSQVTIMSNMFNGCSSLISLDLSNFDTSNVTTMSNMFYDCSSLISLNLSNFDTSKVIRMRNMFTNCPKLEYINLQNFNEISLDNCKDMFKNIFDNVIICINENFTQNMIYSQIEKILNYAINCSYKFELEKCGICSPSSSIRDLCIECNVEHGYYPMENDSSNIREYINCYKGLNGYYLDKNELIYKKCFYTCETCEINGDENSHNCLKCNENYIYESCYSNSNYKNCYDNIYYTNINSITKLQLTIPDHITSILDTKETTYNLNSNISETQKRIQIDSNDEIIYEYILEDPWNIIFYFPNITNNTEIFNTIKNNIISLYNKKNGKSQICIGNENIIFQITNSKNELELLNGDFVNNRNISILDLGKCETILKEKYNINEKDSLIFIKRENTNLKASEKNIQYFVYHPYNYSKLNLSYCDENTINLYVKTELSRETYEIYKDLKSLGYNMFDIMDPFYQDICTPYQYLNQTDIILSDRINYIYNNKDSQCQPSCQFSSYLSKSLYLNCTCEVYIEEKVNNKFSGKKVYESFYDVLKYSNYKIMKCYKLVLNMTSLTKNLGSIFIIILFLIYILCLITYMIKGIKPLNSIIEKEKNIKISIINILR